MPNSMVEGGVPVVAQVVPSISRIPYKSSSTDIHVPGRTQLGEPLQLERV